MPKVRYRFHDPARAGGIYPGTSKLGRSPSRYSIYTVERSSRNRLHKDGDADASFRFRNSDKYYHDPEECEYAGPRVKGYTEDIVQDFERRLDTIFSRQVNRVHILDFEGLIVEIRHALTDRLRMVYTGAEGDVLFTSHAWRRLFEIRGKLLGGARRSMTLEVGSLRVVTDKGDPSDYWAWNSSDGDFLRVVPSYMSIRDRLRRFCHRLIDRDTLRGGRGGQDVWKHFVGRLAEYLGLVNDEGMIGLHVIARGSQRQHGAAAGAPEGAAGAPVIDEEDGEARGGASGISQLLDLSGSTYTRYFETHVPYQRRRVRRRTDDASTSAAPHTTDQPDP
ncbi:hypothetical protein Tco_1254373 [Tanacetum coccineum]